MTTEPPTAPAARPNALLAEDDELIRDIVALYLECLGYNVQEAKDGASAIDLIEKQAAGQLDLLVTDLLMPGANGDTVLQRALECAVCHRFLIVSGFSEQMEALVPAVRESASYLEKPFTFHAFAEKIGELARAPKRHAARQASAF